MDFNKNISIEKMMGELVFGEIICIVSLGFWKFYDLSFLYLALLITFKISILEKNLFKSLKLSFYSFNSIFMLFLIFSDDLFFFATSYLLIFFMIYLILKQLHGENSSGFQIFLHFLHLVAFLNSIFIKYSEIAVIVFISSYTIFVFFIYFLLFRLNKKIIIDFEHNKSLENFPDPDLWKSFDEVPLE